MNHKVFRMFVHVVATMLLVLGLFGLSGPIGVARAGHCVPPAIHDFAPFSPTFGQCVVSGGGGGGVTVAVGGDNGSTEPYVPTWAEESGDSNWRNRLGANQAEDYAVYCFLYGISVFSTQPAPYSAAWWSYDFFNNIPDGGTYGTADGITLSREGDKVTIDDGDGGMKEISVSDCQKVSGRPPSDFEPSQPEDNFQVMVDVLGKELDPSDFVEQVIAALPNGDTVLVDVQGPPNFRNPRALVAQAIAAHLAKQQGVNPENAQKLVSGLGGLDAYNTVIDWAEKGIRLDSVEHAGVPYFVEMVETPEEERGILGDPFTLRTQFGIILNAFGNTTLVGVDSNLEGFANNSLNQVVNAAGVLQRAITHGSGEGPDAHDIARAKAHAFNAGVSLNGAMQADPRAAEIAQQALQIASAQFP